MHRFAFGPAEEHAIDVLKFSGATPARHTNLRAVSCIRLVRNVKMGAVLRRKGRGKEAVTRDVLVVSLLARGPRHVTCVTFCSLISRHPGYKRFVAKAPGGLQGSGFALRFRFLRTRHRHFRPDPARPLWGCLPSVLPSSRSSVGQRSMVVRRLKNKKILSFVTYRLYLVHTRGRKPFGAGAKVPARHAVHAHECMRLRLARIGWDTATSLDTRAPPRVPTAFLYSCRSTSR